MFIICPCTAYRHVHHLQVVCPTFGKYNHWRNHESEVTGDHMECGPQRPRNHLDSTE